MSPLLRTILLGALFVTFSSCEPRHRSLGLTFGAQNEGFDGFACRDIPAGFPFPFLVGRARSGATWGPMSIVVDIVRLRGNPGCRVSQIYAWCQQPDTCEILDEYRQCFTVDSSAFFSGSPDVMTEATIRASMANVFDSLEGERLVKKVPDETVLVRIVGTTETCTGLPATLAFDPARTLGCMISSPVNLSSAPSGDIYVGLDVLVDGCSLSTVTECAASQF